MLLGEDGVEFLDLEQLVRGVADDVVVAHELVLLELLDVLDLLVELVLLVLQVGRRLVEDVLDLAEEVVLLRGRVEALAAALRALLVLVQRGLRVLRYAVPARPADLLAEPLLDEGRVVRKHAVVVQLHLLEVLKEVKPTQQVEAASRGTGARGRAASGPGTWLAGRVGLCARELCPEALDDRPT